MNIILDLIGSTIIGGVVILILLHLNIYSTETKFSSDSQLQMQQNAKTLADIMSYDLRKIGFKYDSTAIITAQEKKISFYSDIDSNGVVDVVTYQLGDSTTALGTTNPNDKVLYRIVNSDTLKGPSLGLVKLKFSYKNEFGSATSVMDSITYIGAELWIETIEKVRNKFPFTYWEITIKPRNI